MANTENMGRVRLRVVGGAVGLVIWLGVLVSLFVLRPLVLTSAPDDGGRGGAIEALWMVLGWIPCVIVGVEWPGRIGPFIRRVTSRKKTAV